MFKIYLGLKTKPGVPHAFALFKKQDELYCGRHIKILQPDDCGDFDSLNQFLENHGIKRQISCPYIAQ